MVARLHPQEVELDAGRVLLIYTLVREGEEPRSWLVRDESLAFSAQTDRMHRSSLPALQHLLTALIEEPRLELHVLCSAKSARSGVLRARRVRAWLVRSGISARRLTVGAVGRPG